MSADKLIQSTKSTKRLREDDRYVLFFDCESDTLFGPCRAPNSREEAFHRMQCTVVCALKVCVESLIDARNDASIDVLIDDAERLACWLDVRPTRGESAFEPLFVAMDNAELIVGYNALKFDFPLLRKYYRSPDRYATHRRKLFDPFVRICEVTDEWPKLDTLLQVHELPPKTGDGRDAVRYWETGQRDILLQYCQSDVVLMAKLFTRPIFRVPRKAGGPYLDIDASVCGVQCALEAIRSARFRRETWKFAPSASSGDE
jgi:hypothetical protein